MFVVAYSDILTQNRCKRQTMNSQKRIIIDDAVPYAKEIFSHLGDVITLPGRDINQSILKDANALIVRSRTQVNQALLEKTNIEFVGSTVVGLDHVDQAYLSAQGIHFYSAQGCNANSVAEFIITALFEAAETFDFHLTNKTLGIIGVGNVGSRLYDKAKKLGIKCLLNDPPKLEQNPELAEKHPYTSLEACLKADFITVHTPLTKTGKHATFNLISAQHLQTLTDKQIVINAARGGIINEQAWIKTKTFANIIDCWENEPYINEALYKTAWIATPHIAGHSLDAKVAGSSMVYEALCQYWNQPVNNQWHTALPAQPETLALNLVGGTQKGLNHLFNSTHNVLDDDKAIRANSIVTVHEKYEHYRRHFPIYREWHQHRFEPSSNIKLNEQLIALGFTPQP